MAAQAPFPPEWAVARAANAGARAAVPGVQPEPESTDASGLYEIVGPHAVQGHSTGVIATLVLTEGQAEALIEGGHIAQSGILRVLGTADPEPPPELTSESAAEPEITAVSGPLPEPTTEEV